MLDICNNGDTLETLRIIKIFIQIIRIIVPLALIVMISKSIFNSVITGELKKELKNSGYKIIAALIIGFLPTIVNLILIVSGNADVYNSCVKNATKEGVQAAYSNGAQTKINKLKTTLSKDDYDEAMSEVTKIKDETKKQELLSEVKELKKYVDISKKVDDLSYNYNSDKYNDLYNEINNIQDENIKEELIKKIKTIDTTKTTTSKKDISDPIISEPKIDDELFQNYINNHAGQYFLIDDELKSILNSKFNGYIYIPQNFSFKKSYSFLIHFGGMGNIYGETVNKNGIGKALKNGYQRDDAIIFCPSEWIGEKIPVQSWIETLVDRLPINMERISIVGLSQGGYKAMSLVSNKTDYYSVAVVAGASSFYNCSQEGCTFDNILQSKKTTIIYSTARNDNLQGTWNYKYSKSEYEKMLENGNKVLYYYITGGSHDVSTSFESLALYDDILKISKNRTYDINNTWIEVSVDSVINNSLNKYPNNINDFPEYYPISQH